MKKFIHFLLLLVIFFVSYFLMQNKTVSTSFDTHKEETDVEPVTDTQNWDCKSECLCQENDPDCDCSQTKSVCTCTDAEGKTVTIESIENNNSDIEELNPDQTFDEDETILAE